MLSPTPESLKRDAHSHCAASTGSAPANTEMDDCDVICPHCGESYQAEAEDFSEDEREETCFSCGGKYVLYDECTVEHHTRASPNIPGQTPEGRSPGGCL